MSATGRDQPVRNDIEVERTVLKRKYGEEAMTAEKRPDEYHVYVRDGETMFYLAADGSFVPDLRMARKFDTPEETFEIINRMTEGRKLPRKSEPGMVRNAWRYV